jgi:superfamily II DNA helicase RecQ
MEMRIRESNGTFKVTVTSLAGRELAVYSEMSGSLTFELREVEEVESFVAEEVDALEFERVPMLRAEELATSAMEEAAAERLSETQAVEKNNAIFHRLSGLRRELAIAEKRPPYMVFPDKTLWNMVEKMPCDLSALAKINGVGASKLEKYGTVFLSALQEIA